MPELETHPEAGTGMLVLEGIPGLSRKHCFSAGFSEKGWSLSSSMILRPNSEAPSPLNQRKAPAMCRSHGAPWGDGPAFDKTSAGPVRCGVRCGGCFYQRHLPERQAPTKTTLQEPCGLCLSCAVEGAQLRLQKE